MTNIFIANLDWEITSDDLTATFSSFGEVTYAHVVFDKMTKKSKGFGYVEMETTDGAIAAIEALNGMDINGRKLDVKIASPKGNRPEKKVFEKKPFEKKSFEKRPYPAGTKPAYNSEKPANSSSEERKQFRKRED
jgi:RNA recognition motif-containing protein